MAKALKDPFFTKDSLTAMGKVIRRNYPSFNLTRFLKAAQDEDWNQVAPETNE